MPQAGLIYRVLIASPSDVIRERQIITDVIHSWNAAHSTNTGAILEPIKWETHSYPELGDRPQGIINKQIVKNSDILIGAFWTRLGTNTGEAASGTAEEIEQFRDEGKPVMLYFSSVPVVPDSLDIAQYRALSDYKTSLQKKGLYSSYDNYEEFRSLLQLHLASSISNIHKESVQSQNEVMFTRPDLNSLGLNSLVLTEEAKTLLVEASHDRHGMILKASYIGGEHIQTNGKVFGSRDNARELASWMDALEQLLDVNCIKPQGYRGELYKVTSTGYRIADTLTSNDPI